MLKNNQICAHPDCRGFIDLTLKYPDPMSPTVNHIVPVKDMAWDDPMQYDAANLEPMHLVCNQRLGAGPKRKRPKHAQSRDWRA